MLIKIFKTFCENTNLHGFVYIVHPERHKAEKIFWFFSIFISFSLTGILIRKIILESQKNPTVIYTDQNVVKIEDLNFPAVSMCPGLIYKTLCQTVIDYDVIKSQLENHERNIIELQINELKLLQVVSLVARDGFLSKNFPSLSIPTDDFMDKFYEFNLTFTDFFLYEYFTKIVRPVLRAPPSNFRGHYANKYAVFLKRLVTEYGPCFTFNSPELKNVYNQKISIDLMHDAATELLTYYQPRGTSLGTWKQCNNISYPVRAHKDGLFLETSIFYVNCSLFAGEGYNHFKSSVPIFEKFGANFIIHDPYEIVSIQTNKFTVNYHQLMVLTVTPEISKLDNSLIGENLDDRNCYLNEERQLNFFKVYNKVNCEHECLATLTLKLCGCVQFFMARNPETKICGIIDEKCFRDAERQFEDHRTTCKCYDSCDNLKYKVSLQTIENQEMLFNSNARLQIRMAVESVLATRRKKSQTISDFFSFVGGLLDLFAGFSFLSVAELLYYFLIAPIKMLTQCNSRVYPLTSRKKNFTESLANSRVLNFMKKMLQKSSIHSFNQIGGDGKSFIERIIWLALFLSSITISALMMQEVYQKFQDKNIVMKWEQTQLDLRQVPLPAITIMRYVYLRDRHNQNKSMLDLSDKIYMKNLQDQAFYIPQKSTYEHNLDFKTTSDLVEYLKLYDALDDPPFQVYHSTLNNQKIPSAHVLTHFQYGLAFNLMNFEQLFHNETISKDFAYSYDSKEVLNFPLKTALGENNELSIEFNIWNTDYLFENFFFLHPANELPRDTHQDGIIKKSIFNILLMPNVIKVDESLKSFDIGTRNCYLDNERKLTFFKIYTQKNCELECMSYVVYDECTCIPYFYVRNSSMDVCDLYSHANCANKFDFFQASKYDHLFESHGVCNCLQLCNNVEYTYEIHTSKLNSTSRNSVIKMRWKDSEYFALIRFQEYNYVDFFSYAGGILGLFAGISALSIIETFYFLTMRLITDIVRFRTQ